VKKQIGKKLRTSLGNLIEGRVELGLAELRLVTGAGNRRIGGGGLGGIGGIGGVFEGGTTQSTTPASMTEPGQTDTATDTQSDQ
jgi:hypothetical protein